MEITASPGLPEPADIHTMAVYDPKTGAVVHQHHVVRFKGAPKRSRKDLEARAIELARSQTAFDGPLAVLHAEPGAFERPGLHTVDLKSKTLRVRSSPGASTAEIPRRGKATKRQPGARVK